MEPDFSRVTIIGVGMIGGSLGRALLSRGIAAEVVGVDPSAVVLETAASLGAVSRGTTSLAQGVDGATLVVLSTPVGITLQLLPQLAGLLAPDVIVTDVGSTKVEVMSRARSLLPDGLCFVGGHPMTGSEKGGVRGLDAHLFENALYVLTPDGCGEGDALDRVTGMVRGIGAFPVVMDARRHDFLAAAVSHLPHLAATALVRTVAGLTAYRNEILALAAGGFRDATRVAQGSPEMWKDICLSNADEIGLLLDRYIEGLAHLRRMVGEKDEKGLLAEFRDAREFRLQVPFRGKGILPTLFNLYVYVPDRPGIIGEMASGLGGAGINIAEIELLRVREEEGGPLRLGFLSEEGRADAAALLKADGYRAEIRED